MQLVCQIYFNHYYNYCIILCNELCVLILHSNPVRLWSLQLGTIHDIIHVYIGIEGFLFFKYRESDMQSVTRAYIAGIIYYYIITYNVYV